MPMVYFNVLDSMSKRLPCLALPNRQIVLRIRAIGQIKIDFERIRTISQDRHIGLSGAVCEQIGAGRELGPNGPAAASGTPRIGIAVSSAIDGDHEVPIHAW